MSRFVGKLDFAPQDPRQPDEWRLGRDFGFVRDDGMMIIAQSGGHTDGASIPRLLWRVIGHPFRRGNRFWAIPHDAGYNRCAVVIDLIAAELQPEYALDNWRNSSIVGFVHSANLSRRWWDGTLAQAMVAMRERRWKRKVVYGAVRLFGRRAYCKHRGTNEILPGRTRGSVGAEKQDPRGNCRGSRRFGKSISNMGLSDAQRANRRAMPD